jgi:hypothetical protein
MIIPLACGVLLVGVASASATVVHVAGNTLMIDAGRGERNSIDAFLGYRSDGVWRWYVNEEGGTPIAPGAGCAPSGAGEVACTQHAGINRVRATGGNRSDVVAVATWPGFGVRVKANGGKGFDEVVLGGPHPTHGLAIGGPGPDHLYSGDGNDRLAGGPGDDSFTGEGGRDEIIGGAGADSMEGGKGNDTIAARDGERDHFIQCGAGKRDRVTWDRRRDPRPKRCGVG